MTSEKRYTEVVTREQVTDEILDLVREICDGWYLDKPIDWEDVWERAEKTPLADWSTPDFGTQTTSPAMALIKRTIRKERSES